MLEKICLVVFFLYAIPYSLILLYCEFKYNKEEKKEEKEKRVLMTLSLDEKDYRFLMSEMQKNDAIISIKHGEDMQCWSIAQISTKDTDISAGKEH